MDSHPQARHHVEFRRIAARRHRFLEALLEKEDPALWVTLAYKYEVHGWLFPSLHALARRQEALRMNEVEALGIGTVVKMAEVRESFPFGKDNGYYRNSYASRATHNFEQEIRRLFSEELASPR